jgi:hypothetical protein
MDVVEYAAKMVADGGESLAEDDLNEDGEIADELHQEACDLAISIARAIGKNPAATVEFARQVAAEMPGWPMAVIYLLYSGKHEAWWKPNANGYTKDQAEAGRYDEATATRYVVQSAQSGILTQVTRMVAAPDNWAEPTS